MKVLFALVTFFSLSSAFAQYSVAIKEGDRHLSAAKVELESVAAICPEMEGGIRCHAYGMTATVKVTMSGCVDRMGGYFSYFEERDRKGYLYFSAVNIFNKTSMVARCVKTPTESIRVSIPFEGEIVLVQLPYNGAGLTTEVEM